MNTYTVTPTSGPEHTHRGNDATDAAIAHVRGCITRSQSTWPSMVRLADGTLSQFWQAVEHKPGLPPRNVRQPFSVRRWR